MIIQKIKSKFFSFLENHDRKRIIMDRTCNEPLLTRYYLFLDIIDQIKNDKVKVIFVNNTPDIVDKEHRCLIGVLEYYFIDAEFKKLFLQNFHLVNHVIVTKKVKPLKKLRFITGEKASIFDQAKPTTVKITQDYEVYVRNEKN